MNNYNFNRDFYEGCRALGDKEGMALAWAMLRYGYEGIEPKLKPTTMAAFTFARGRIDAMVNGSLGGLRRAANTGSQGGSQGGSQANAQGGSRQASQGGSQQKEKEKEKEITLAGYSAARQTPDDFDPPSMEDVEAYFAANCLRGDPPTVLRPLRSTGLDATERPARDRRVGARPQLEPQTGWLRCRPQGAGRADLPGGRAGVRVEAREDGCGAHSRTQARAG